MTAGIWQHKGRHFLASVPCPYCFLSWNSSPMSPLSTFAYPLEPKWKITFCEKTSLFYHHPTSTVPGTMVILLLSLLRLA